MSKAIILICHLLLILALPVTYGQESELKFKYITEDQGLSSNRIFCVYRDNRQFLWIGTDMGLNRYNGYQSIKYLHNNDVKGSISDNSLRCINEDSEGNLLVGTSNGLNLYDRESDSFTLLKSDSSDTSTISSPNINSMLLDRKGNFWIMAGGNCLNKWIPGQKKFIRYQFKNDDKAFYNSSQSIAEDSKGNIWVVSFTAGIYCLKSGADRLVALGNADINFGDRGCKSLFIDEQDIIWIASDGGGFHSFDPSSGKAAHYNTMANGSGTNKALLRWIVAENSRYLLIAVNQGGINRFDKVTKTFKYITYDEDNGSGLNNNGVWSLYKDKEGILWVGTGNGGVNYYNPKEYNFKIFRHTRNSSRSPSDNTIGGFFEDSKGLIWIATDGEGLNLFDPATKTFKVFKHDVNNPYSISGNTIRNIEEDSNSNLWIGTWDDGLNKYDRKTGKFIHYMPDKLNKASISGKKVWHIKKDFKGLLWIAIMDEGIEIFDKDKGVIKRYNIDSLNPEANHSIRQFLEEQHRFMWVCSWKGLYRYDRTTDKFAAFKNFPDNDVRAFFKDSKGNYWVGSFDKGLFMMDFNGHIKKVYNDKNGLPNNQIHGIVEDSHRDLWISTNFGISRFNPEKETFTNYFKSDGLQGNQFFTLSFLKTRSGDFYVGGFDGFNIFNPDKLKLNETVPPVYFTSFEVFNKPVTLHAPGATVQLNISEVKQITLKWNQSMFSLGFTAINYTFAEKNQYAYKLEGFDHDWNYVGTSRLATYTNLDPGHYLLRVKASNNDGVWNEQGTSVKVIITPPYWLTWWFKTGVVLIILGSAIAFYFVRLNAVKFQKRTLEHKVQEQTAQLLIKNAQLLVSNEEERKARQEADLANTSKSVFLATMSHEIRTPMNGVIGMASLLEHTELTTEQRELAETITTCGEGLLTVINDILDFSKIESGKMELENKAFNLRSCIESVLDVFARKSALLGLELIYQIDSDVPTDILGDHLRLRQILMNLVGNAIKFTQSGEVFIGVHLLNTYEDKSLDISFDVRDTGIGIPADKMERLFKAFSQVDSSTTRKYGGTGLGLVISEKLVALMGGQISVTSKIGTGSVFTFNIHTYASLQDSPKSSFNMTELEGKHVLVVDDNLTNRKIFSAQLEHWKLLPTLACSGKEALHFIAQSQAFDLAIIDMHMPEVNGVDLARVISLAYPALPIILVTSLGDNIEKQDFYLFKSRLTKPVKQDVLAKCLLNELGRKTVIGIDNTPALQNLEIDFSIKFPFKMMVADDNLINQKLALKVLAKLGYIADVASDGKEVLHLINIKEYDLILMDVQMPEINGLEATKTIRKMSITQPIIIAMTANAMQGDKEECLEAGMDDYISKPVDLKALVATLQKWGERMKVN